MEVVVVGCFADPGIASDIPRNQSFGTACDIESRSMSIHIAATPATIEAEIRGKIKMATSLDALTRTGIFRTRALEL